MTVLTRYAPSNGRTPPGFLVQTVPDVQGEEVVLKGFTLGLKASQIVAIQESGLGGGGAGGLVSQRATAVAGVGCAGWTAIEKQLPGPVTEDTGMACGTSTPEMSQAARAATSARQYELVGRGAVQNRLGKRSGLGSPSTTAAGLSGRPQSGQCGDRTNKLEGGGGGTQQRSHSGPFQTYPGLPWGAAGRGLVGSQNQNRSPEGVNRGGGYEELVRVRLGAATLHQLDYPC